LAMWKKKIKGGTAGKNGRTEGSGIAYKGKEKRPRRGRAKGGNTGLDHYEGL